MRDRNVERERDVCIYVDSWTERQTEWEIEIEIERERDRNQSEG